MKIELLTNIRGAKEWVKGEVLTSPFHPDIQGMFKRPDFATLIKVIAPDAPLSDELIKTPAVEPPKVQETIIPPEEKIELKKEPEVDKPIDKKVELPQKKKVVPVKIPLLKKGKQAKK